MTHEKEPGVRRKENVKLERLKKNVKRKNVSGISKVGPVD